MPDQLLTIEEYRALGETDRGFTELVEGRIVPSPGAGRAHNLAACRLAAQLERQLPRGLAFVLGTDLDLGLAPPGEPGFARRPDLLVFDRAAGEPIRADAVAVVIELVTPGSRRTDYRVKHDEYADAGIPHYWIVDLAEPVTLIACQGYQDGPAVTGTFATSEPFPVELDLGALIGQHAGTAR
ncbi:Uma2 family endonuclease [Amycolatopsis solani]|uniref:Uma2 family endonuclease n=1 Tax=Amycolatopsis solani TaxID=3028615 RepID=UPI0025B17F24|nr:Uma2 family endonuclease [Amycolatopsis sp. MEP2-6]